MNLKTATMEKRLHLVKLSIILFSFFFILSLIIHPTKMATAKSTTIPINVGVVLDMNGSFGQMSMSCISMALADFYGSHGHYKTRLVLSRRDSNRSVVGAAAAALDLLTNVQVQAIIGPVSSMQANFMIDLGEKAHVPIISFSATSPFLSSIPSQYFIRATQNDSYQVKAISSIVQAFGWRQVVPIYVGNDFGEGIIPFLTDALEEINTRVPYRSVISLVATDDEIIAELNKLMGMETRVFIVHMNPSLGSRVFAKAKLLGMMNEGYAWIITDAMTNMLKSIDPSVIEKSMEGVIGVKTYVPQSKNLDSFINRWKSEFQENNPEIPNLHLNVFGLWAYDLVTALAMAVEKARILNNSFKKPKISGNSTDLETFGVSKNGAKLLEAILSTKFSGLSGDFNLADGKLQPPPYQIVNVIGNGEKEIGFWTVQNGIVRNLNSAKSNLHSPKKSNFRAIIWPGDTTTPPKGWLIPRNGKMLRVGVPIKEGYTEFARMRNSVSNRSVVEGFCIDVFEAVMACLPYDVPYEYIPYVDSDGIMVGTYNDLIYEVYLGNFDAVAGDTTIRENRSQYVDFSLPFTESGVSLIVPIKDNKSKSLWAFLKPLTLDLWLTSFISFVIIGVLIWVLEHRINKEFRGPASHQVGTMFWFSFSTMVFAHKEKISSNLAKFVLIIWFWFVLTLVQSYTASLTSMLTVQQLQPTITDINDLIKNKENVGYAYASFVYGLLLRMGFDGSRLIPFRSEEECHELLNKGSKNGGIAAAFHESPYINLFFAKYCGQYTTIQPTYKTDGFGFVFPIGSPLITDVSRAVLNVTQNQTIMEGFEKKWFPHSSCLESGAISSNSLDIRSFGGLFLMIGVSSLSAFVIFLTMFLHEHWHIVTNSNVSLRRRLAELFRHFDVKDCGCHSRNTEQSARMSIGGGDDGNKTGENEASPQQNSPPSPVIVSQEASPSAFGLSTPAFSSLSEGQENCSHESGSINQQSITNEKIMPVIELNRPNQKEQTTHVSL